MKIIANRDHSRYAASCVVAHQNGYFRWLTTNGLLSPDLYVGTGLVLEAR